ncbi:MAG: hypothetical protein ACFB0G_11310 [Leptolyngbyaceae cyanobacterium]
MQTFKIKPSKRAIAIGSVTLALLCSVAAWRVVNAGKPGVLGNGDLDAVATDAYQQGTEAGREEGFSDGRRAAMLPTIGDATQSAAIALNEADHNSAALFDAFVCSRKNAWRKFAEENAEGQRGQIAELEKQLQLVALEPMKALTTQFPHEGELQAQGENFALVANPVIENRAIVLAIYDLMTGITEGCTLDFVPALTANNAYLLQSAMAASQRRDAIKMFDQQLEGLASQEVETDEAPAN